MDASPSPAALHARATAPPPHLAAHSARIAALIHAASRRMGARALQGAIAEGRVVALTGACAVAILKPGRRTAGGQP